MSHLCKLDTCSRLLTGHTAQGLCKLHYNRLITKGDVLVDLAPHRTKASKKYYGTSLYHSWQNMKARCNNINSDQYKNYGGRGITYTSDWETFEGFYNDMGQTYKKGLSLDREDVNGNYSPSNCRWATDTEQARNKRNTRYFTIGGVTKTMPEWIADSGLRPSTVRQRINAYKWPIKKALGMGEY